MNPVSNNNVGRFMVAAGAIVEHPESGSILVLKRGKVAFKAGVWETGYGRLEQGEEPIEGLLREFKEETGLNIRPKQLLTSWFFNRSNSKGPENEVVGFTYWAISESQDVKLSDEHSEYRWVTPEEALDLISEEGVRRDIRAFQEAKKRADAAATLSEKHQRALADYQNLVRRTQEERATHSRLAALEIIEKLLQPLEHLKMAAEQLDDAGLNMVEKEMWQVLAQFGLEEIEVMDKDFDVETMEVVDREGDGNKVKKVLRPGYALNGKIIQHAKVVLGA